MDKLDFYSLLNKGNRLEGCYEGNRNPWMAAKMYFAQIAKRGRLFEWVKMAALGNGKSEAEVEKTALRTMKVVEKRRAQAYAFACTQMVGRGMRHNATRVLAQMVLYGWHSGYCCASQSAIGEAIGLSRERVCKWIRRLREAGVLELVSYDARGHYVWRGRSYVRWCLVFDIFFRWGSPKRHTNPISASALRGSVVGHSA